jgi:hypothetical protein
MFSARKSPGEHQSSPGGDAAGKQRISLEDGSSKPLGGLHPVTRTEGVKPDLSDHPAREDAIGLDWVEQFVHVAVGLDPADSRDGRRVGHAQGRYGQHRRGPVGGSEDGLDVPVRPTEDLEVRDVGALRHRYASVGNRGGSPGLAVLRRHDLEKRPEFRRPRVPGVESQ